VPWCDRCSRFLTPSTVTVEGACPSCGRPVDPGRAHAAVTAANDEQPMPVPWHLKLLAGALAVYLGYRFLQMGEWLWHAVW
jgi:hypothetical protein